MLKYVATAVASITLAAGIAVAGAQGAHPASVQALDNPGSNGATNAAQHRPSDRPTPGAGQLKACEKRGDAVKKRSQQLGERAAKMEDTFAQISQRVEIYYTGTVVPSGKTIAHYDQLVADIATKKQAVDASLAKVKSDADAFSCDQDPKGQVNAFRTDMRQTIDALKRYRTSVKNLIVAVRSVTGETNRTASPRPQVSPKGANHE